MATQLSIELRTEKAIDSLNKLTSAMEGFSKDGSDAIEDVSRNYDSLSEAEKRAFNSSKKQFTERQKQLARLSVEYEKFFQKQAKGEKFTDEEIVRLNRLVKEYKECRGALSQTSKELTSTSKKFKSLATSENRVRTITPQVTHNFDALAVSVGAVAASITAASTALAYFAADTDKQIAKLEAMTNITGDATQAYYKMNDAQRYLGYEADTFNEYFGKLVGITGSAEKAAEAIKAIGDATAALGGAEQQFDQMADHLTVIGSTNILNDSDIEALQEIGFVNAKEVIAQGVGAKSYEDIDKAVVTGKQAYDILIDYMNKNFEGAMAKQSDNMADMFDAISKNALTLGGEIGLALAEAFDVDDIMRDIRDFLEEALQAFRKAQSGVISYGDAIDETFGEGTSKYLSFAATMAEGIGTIYLVRKGYSKFSEVAKASSEASKELNSSIDTLNSRMGGLGTTLASNLGNMMDAVLTAHELKQSYEDLNKSTKAFDSDMSILVTPFDEIRKKQANYNKEKEEMARIEQRMADANEKTRQSVLKTGEAINALASGGEAASIAIESMGSANKKTAENAQKITSTMANAGKATENVAKTAKKAKGEINYLGVAVDKMCTFTNRATLTTVSLAEAWIAIKASVSAGFAVMATSVAAACAKIKVAIVTLMLNPLTLVISALALIAWKMSETEDLISKNNLSEVWARNSFDAADAEGTDLLEQAKENIKKGDQMSKAYAEANRKEKERRRRIHESTVGEDAIRKEMTRMNKLKEKMDELNSSTPDLSDNISTEDYVKQMMQAEQEIKRYSIEVRNKINQAKLENDIHYSENLQSLFESVGAKEAAIANKRLINEKKLNLEIVKNRNNYDQQILAATQSKENKLYELSKATDARQREILQKQIGFIDQQLKELVEAHKQDEIQIKIHANINQMNQDLSYAVNRLQELKDYAEDGTIGELRQKANDSFDINASASLSNYNKNATALAEANAKGDTGGIMTIGDMLGLSPEEIQARGTTLSAMYETVSTALVNATAQEIACHQGAKDAALEHATEIEQLQSYMNDYAVSIGKNLGGAFSDWITGVKTAQQAIAGFAQELITSAIQIMAQWLGVYAILLACGAGPRGASRGASKAVLGIDAKADGGLVVGPGGPRSDVIPTMLSNGEYVINARAVDALGLNTLNTINQGRLPHFADGGPVGKVAPSSPSSANVVLNVSTMDSSSFTDFLRRGGLDKIKQALYSDTRNFAGETGVF